jgi:hypothetical protein
MLLKEPTIILRRRVPIASLHEGIPQQHREAMTVQNPCAQPVVLNGAVRVVSHVRQELGRLEFSNKNIPARQQAIGKYHNERIRA